MIQSSRKLLPNSLRRKIVLLGLEALLIVSCGARPQHTISTTLERHDVPVVNMTVEDTQKFLDHATSISTSDANAGSIPAIEFLRVMPLQDDQRDILANAFPGSFAVTCSAGHCQAVANGSPAQATMNVDIDGIINPSLVLDSTITTQFVLRGANAIEFCNTDGLAVSKFFFTRQIQGLRLSLSDNSPVLTVNIDDDDENYTCQ